MITGTTCLLMSGLPVFHKHDAQGRRQLCVLGSSLEAERRFALYVHCIAYKCRMIYFWWIGKDLEQIDGSVISAFAWRD
jgi:hypothetical protein